MRSSLSSADPQQFEQFKMRVLESVVNCHTTDGILKVLEAMMAVETPATPSARRASTGSAGGAAPAAEEAALTAEDGGA